MTKFYATLDADGSHIVQNAHIQAFDTERAARQYLIDSYRDSLEDGETLHIDAGDFGDCWIKSYHRPAADDPMLDPYDFADLIVQAPGQHPGGNQFWVSPFAPVLVAQIVAADSAE